MSDFYYQSRANIISTMQCSLKQIRQVLNIGVQELADIIGVTRQTINNIENNKNKLSTVQYISICAVIDYLLEKQKISYHVIAAILESNKVIGDDNVYTEDIPILQRFFLTFADDSKLVSSPFCNMAVIGQESYMKLFQDYKVFLDDIVGVALISELDVYAGIEERLLAQTALEHLVLINRCFLENFIVSLKAYLSTLFRTLAYFL